jgi:hypothetical protein
MMRNSEREAVGATTRGVNKGVIPNSLHRREFPHTGTDTALDRFTEDEGLKISPKARTIFSSGGRGITFRSPIHDRLRQRGVHGSGVSLSDQDERITSGTVVLPEEVPEFTPASVR